MTHRTPTPHEIPERVLARIWDRVERRDPDECWPWLLSVGSHGYGQVGWHIGGGKNAMTTAHRVVWVAVNGPIPEGMTVDHNRRICDGGICCNPTHLRLLPNVDNARDNGQGLKTHCPRGHPYDDKNTYIDPENHRRCRKCARARSKKMAKLKSTGKRYNEHRRKNHELRDQLDAEIVKARDEGKTYAEIASEIGLSVAWVQASLKRSGIVGQPTNA